MTRRTLAPSRLAALALLSFALAGCHAAMSTPETPSPASPGPGYTNAVDHWPLVFNAHWFGASCFSTYGCRVVYAGFPHREDPHDRLKPTIESLGPAYPGNLRGGWGPVPNFPPPAIVDWRSADGAEHHAEIDIGEIFKDQLVRHNVPREEVGRTYDPQPEIILEVNDRTINVYMKATIYTRDEQIPGNKYSRMRDDPIKVFSHTY